MSYECEKRVGGGERRFYFSSKDDFSTSLLSFPKLSLLLLCLPLLQLFWVAFELCSLLILALFNFVLGGL
eukprot:m.28059 g.28059  ORF g.28059 m.28059 type:complete len:70 (-) comp6011_c0_seq1:1447-1656(-)